MADIHNFPQITWECFPLLLATVAPRYHHQSPIRDNNPDTSIRHSVDDRRLRTLSVGPDRRRPAPLADLLFRIPDHRARTSAVSRFEHLSVEKHGAARLICMI